MATSQKNLSEYNLENLPDASSWKIGIVVSSWNGEITGNLLKGAREVLETAGINEDNVVVESVPGSFELPLGAQLLIKGQSLDGVICLGSVIRGETAHFDFVCHACSQGIMQVGLKHNLPVIFGVLTDDNIDQAKARSGGKHGNKGVEAAVSCLQMIAISKNQGDSWGLEV